MSAGYIKRFTIDGHAVKVWRNIFENDEWRAELVPDFDPRNNVTLGTIIRTGSRWTVGFGPAHDSLESAATALVRLHLSDQAVGATVVERMGACSCNDPDCTNHPSWTPYAPANVCRNRSRPGFEGDCYCEVCDPPFTGHTIGCMCTDCVPADAGEPQTLINGKWYTGVVC
jgi:hypothetical protein